VFATRIESNYAGEGAAIYKDWGNNGTGYIDSGIYINGGSPSRLGTDCGPETIAQLGGATECAPATPCNTFNGNRTQNADTSFSPGSVIYDFLAKLIGSRFSMQDNEAAYAISAHGGLAQVERCLITDNHATNVLIYAAGNSFASFITSFDECTIAHNAIDGTYVFDLASQTAPSLSRDIIYEPGHSSAFFTPNHPGDTLSVSYTMTTDATLLDPAKPTIVYGVPAFVDQANGDYHLAAFPQTALDFAPALGDVDLDGLPGAVDLPVVVNKFGAGDLGAYERQNMFYNCGNNSDTLFCDGFDH
jgi:hypothetical protein